MFAVIRCDRHCRLVIGVEHGSAELSESQFMHEMAEPDEFLHSEAHGVVFRFGG